MFPLAARSPIPQDGHRFDTLRVPKSSVRHRFGSLRSPIIECGHRFDTLYLLNLDIHHLFGTLRLPNSNVRHRFGLLRSPIIECGHRSDAPRTFVTVSARCARRSLRMATVSFRLLNSDIRYRLDPWKWQPFHRFRALRMPSCNFVIVLMRWAFKKKYRVRFQLAPFIDLTLVARFNIASHANYLLAFAIALAFFPFYPFLIQNEWHKNGPPGKRA